MLLQNSTKTTTITTGTSSDGYEETATHASKKYESTLAALNVTTAISNAAYIRRDKPHSKKQIKMRFNEIVELSAELKDIGCVKIIVGQRRNKKFVHYCITKKDS